MYFLADTKFHPTNKRYFFQKFRALEFLNLQPENAKPFLAILSPPAPHAPYLPASRHSKAFANIKAPRTQNFNIASGPFGKLA